MAEETPTTKIVIVSGEEFQVPVETDNEAIRQHLAQTFPDVAGATLQTGTRKIGEVTYQTVEFIKRAGTKGMDERGLLVLLAQVPQEPLDAPPPGPPFADRALVVRLLRGELTAAEAVALDQSLYNALDACARADAYSPATDQEGITLCNRLFELDSVAASVPFAW